MPFILVPKSAPKFASLHFTLSADSGSPGYAHEC